MRGGGGRGKLSGLGDERCRLGGCDELHRGGDAGRGFVVLEGDEVATTLLKALAINLTDHLVYRWGLQRAIMMYVIIARSAENFLSTEISCSA